MPTVVNKVKAVVAEAISGSVVVKCSTSCASLTWSLEQGSYYELSRQRYSEVEPHVVVLSGIEAEHARKHLADIAAEQEQAEQAEATRQRKGRLQEITRIEARDREREQRLDREFEPLMTRIGKRFGLVGK